MAGGPGLTASCGSAGCSWHRFSLGRDASHHSSLGFARLVGATADEMIVHVLIGVPRPDKVNVDAVVAALPHGRTTVQVVGGGLERLNADGSDGTLIANAIITVSIDDGT